MFQVVQKTFLHLLDICMLNAYYLYQLKQGKKLSLRLFSKSVLMSLFSKFGVCNHLHPGITLRQINLTDFFLVIISAVTTWRPYHHCLTDRSARVSGGVTAAAAQPDVLE